MPESVAEADDGGLKYTPRNSRQGIATHYYNNATRQELQDQCDDRGTCCGIYELKVVKGKTEAVVYIGSTHRRSGKSLYHRLSEYMTDGSHIRRIIQSALNQGFAIHARWIKLSQELCDEKCKGNRINIAEELENWYLNKFDYAWNTRCNGSRRQIHGISVQT